MKTVFARRIRWLVVPMLASLALGGCGGGGGDDATGPAEVAGVYDLVSVNGRTLPAVAIEIEGYRLELLSSELTLQAGGTYSETTQLRETEDGTTTDSPFSTTGTYAVSGSRITLTDEDGDSVTGTVSGDRITLAEQGVTLVYER
ncbi:MAG TPA: lipocalin family protein [Gemmatimonadaceae bacterium]|nr:lipocalin family protein [Gemmatimonadaceae bacterium]